MFYFSLPYFVENKDFNDKLVDYILGYTDITIASCYGNFPYSYWSGDNNTCCGDNEVFTNSMVQGFLRDVKTSLEIDASNIFLDDIDFFLPHLKMILDNIKDAGHYVKITNPNFIKYLPRSTKGILSVSACYLSQQTAETINSFIESYSNLYSIEIPADYNIEWDKIKDKSKIVIVLGDGCARCENCESCLSIKHSNQFNFSINDIECDKEYNNNWKEQFEEYKLKGFTCFRFKTPKVDQLSTFNKDLINFFIREEDRYEFYSSWVV